MRLSIRIWQCTVQLMDMASRSNPFLGIMISPLLLSLVFFSVEAAGPPIERTITPSRPLKYGETILSPGEHFALGFFSPISSEHRYVGIWYNKLLPVPEQTVVWVANRENPLKSGSSSSSPVPLLAVIDGNMALMGGGDPNPLWSTNVILKPLKNYSATATLTDDGNLVLQDDTSGEILWESFDHPTDTLLPGMKLGWDRRRGLDRQLTSWKIAALDPAPGKFSHGVVLGELPQIFLKKGSVPVYRCRPWIGPRMHNMNISMTFHFQNVVNEDETYTRYSVREPVVYSRMVLEESEGQAKLRFLTWLNESQRWNPVYEIPKDQCDNYARCGPYGSCNPAWLPDSECTCITSGFEHRSPKDWAMGVWSGGCVRRHRLECGARGGKRDGFRTLSRVKLPDTTRSRVEPGLSSEACSEACLRDCNCTAYAVGNVTGKGYSCLRWTGDLLDLNADLGGLEDLHVRVPAAELDEPYYSKKRGWKAIIKMVVAAVSAGIFMGAFISFICRWRRLNGRKLNRTTSVALNLELYEEKWKGTELLLFPINVIKASTDDFSTSNLLGIGGFGSVYKGKLLNGQEIAVKRLCRSSGQGAAEFKNEVLLIAKLQHRNLVRLLGCCINGEEKMLIYEYMHNKSLDCYIFDQKGRQMLDWSKRFNIIVGIARGILYLHEDSRLRIIHRDLTVSNVLLTDELNPKISDFGLARIFGENQTQEKTQRVVGTYGYMSPEYAMNGLFSVKSDVFSFGIIVMEIISGKRNHVCYCDGSPMTMIGYAWKTWKEGNILEFADPLMGVSFEKEVSKCIQVGLLCVQESAIDRPNMSSVVFMLGSNETNLPSPKEPAFCLLKAENCSHQHSSTSTTGFSESGLSITEMEGR